MSVTHVHQPLINTHVCVFKCGASSILSKCPLNNNIHTTTATWLFNSYTSFARWCGETIDLAPWMNPLFPMYTQQIYARPIFDLNGADRQEIIVPLQQQQQQQHQPTPATTTTTSTSTTTTTTQVLHVGAPAIVTGSKSGTYGVHDPSPTLSPTPMITTTTTQLPHTGAPAIVTGSQSGTSGVHDPSPTLSPTPMIEVTGTATHTHVRMRSEHEDETPQSTTQGSGSAPMTVGDHLGGVTVIDETQYGSENEDDKAETNA